MKGDAPRRFILDRRIPVIGHPNGRRPSGMIFTSAEVPKEALPSNVIVQMPGIPEAPKPETPPAPDKEECELKVLKRQAKEIAEQLSGVPCKVRERHGYCEMIVSLKKGAIQISETSWWRVLRVLKAELDKDKAE